MLTNLHLFNAAAQIRKLIINLKSFSLQFDHTFEKKTVAQISVPVYTLQALREVQEVCTNFTVK